MNSQTTYLYQDRDLTRAQLQHEVEADAVGQDPEQWVDGEFDFDDWLADALVTGRVTKIHTDQ
ncbi:hypothetical protein [Mycolicibacterium mengxianglii]|uniref:hypothetical protein n=1 Tax=Mycolicibacterium mengxianglii TaxID=2736649 RepID=UPI0018D1A01B|nr:hypothetical protein [Mycolicibacterium mengxianglii]